MKLPTSSFFRRLFADTKAKTNSKSLFNLSKGLIFVYLFLAILMISSSLLELRQSKKELLNLMESQSHSLLESLLIASGNILRADIYLNEAFEKRALDQANLIKTLYENGLLTEQYLNHFAEKRHIPHIRIYDYNGKTLIASQTDMRLPENLDDVDQLFYPLISGEADTLILGLRSGEDNHEFYYALALATNNRRVVYLDINASGLINMRRQSGFGVLIRSIVSDNRNIIYAALQDTVSILAASGNVSQLSDISDSEFLLRAFQDSLFLTHVSEFDSLSVFEAVHPLVYDGRKLGLFRLGLSLKPLDDINDRIIRRLIIITFILIVIGSIFFTYIFFRQRYQLLQKEYSVVETYSGSIIENVSDAIIVSNERDGVKIFNGAAENLFQKSKRQACGKQLSSVLTEKFRRDVNNAGESIAQIEYEQNGRTRFLLVSQNSFTDINNELNIIVLCRDMTRIQALESQIQRKERLSAMGQLAAGVAHEIRNPLNTIGTIAQQLHRDFLPTDGREEYKDLNKLVIDEVKRINKTIQEFLAFTKPEPINPQRFGLSDWLNGVQLQFKNMLAEKSIVLQIKNEYNGSVNWDIDQMRQVMLNLIQNAIDALQTGGNIDLNVSQIKKNTLQIILHDNGAGVPKETRDRIFNIYFSTKPGGTGIGLSIVQRIIQDHNGLIEMESKTGDGTKFIIEIPVDIVPEINV